MDNRRDKVGNTMDMVIRELTILKTRLNTVCEKLDELVKFQKDFIDRFARIEERVLMLEDLRDVIHVVDNVKTKCEVLQSDIEYIKQQKKELNNAIKQIKAEQNGIKKEVSILSEFKRNIEKRLRLESITRSNLKIALIGVLAGAGASAGIELFRLLIVKLVGG